LANEWGDLIIQNIKRSILDRITARENVPVQELFYVVESKWVTEQFELSKWVCVRDIKIITILVPVTKKYEKSTVCLLPSPVSDQY